MDVKWLERKLGKIFPLRFADVATWSRDGRFYRAIGVRQMKAAYFKVGN